MSLPYASSTSNTSIKYALYLNSTSVLCIYPAYRSSYSVTSGKYNTSTLYNQTETTLNLTGSDTVYYTYQFSSEGSGPRYLNVGEDTHFTISYSYNGAEYIKCTGIQVLLASTTYKCITFKVVANQTTSTGSTYLSISKSPALIVEKLTINISAKQVITSVKATGSIIITDAESCLNDYDYVALMCGTGSGDQYVLAYSQWGNAFTTLSLDIFNDGNIVIPTITEPITEFYIGHCGVDYNPDDKASYDRLDIDFVSDVTLSRFLSEDDYDNDNLYQESILYDGGDGIIAIDEDSDYYTLQGEEVWLFTGSGDDDICVSNL